jgi:hypothetical protein
MRPEHTSSTSASALADHERVLSSVLRSPGARAAASAQPVATGVPAARNIGASPNDSPAAERDDERERERATV